MILRAWRKYREFCRKEAELSQAMRRLARAPQDYIMIQQLCDAVSSGYNVEITVKSPDGGEIVIKRSTSQNQIPFETFAEKYRKFHQ